MPYSDAFGKAWAVPLYTQAAPRMVVEVGPGAGWWSNTLRPHHRGVWTGIEAWEPYVAGFGLDALYDVILVGDVMHPFRREVCRHADLVILGDVLEHLAQDDAADLVTDLRDRGVGLLVSVPIVECPQGAVGGNPYETHRWHPTHDGMLELVDPDVWAVKPDDHGVGVYWRGRR